MEPNGPTAHPEPRKPSAAWVFVGSGCYTGFSPIASGTAGSALGLLVYLLIPGFADPYVIMPVTVGLFLLGVEAAERLEAYYGHDPSQVTIDEVVGMWVSLFLLPSSVFLAVLGFFLFRLFDIIKPFPARMFDRSRGGFGIMMDDVVAAVYTNIALHIVAAVQQFTGL